MKAPHSKCGVRATVPGVRIPPCPPISPSLSDRFEWNSRKRPEVRERIAATGAEPVGQGVAEFTAALAAEYEAMAKLAQRVKFELE